MKRDLLGERSVGAGGQHHAIIPPSQAYFAL